MYTCPMTSTSPGCLGMVSESPARSSISSGDPAKSLAVRAEMDDQPPRYRSSAKCIQYALALLDGGLLQGRLLRSRRGCRSLHHRGFLLQPLDQLLAAGLLQFTNFDPFEHRCPRIGFGEPAGALQQRAQAFARPDAIHPRLADFAAQGDLAPISFQPACWGTVNTSPSWSGKSWSPFPGEPPPDSGPGVRPARVPRTNSRSHSASGRRPRDSRCAAIRRQTHQVGDTHIGRQRIPARPRDIASYVHARGRNCSGWRCTRSGRAAGPEHCLKGLRRVRRLS